MYKELCIIYREEIDEDTGCEELGNERLSAMSAA